MISESNIILKYKQYIYTMIVMCMKSGFKAIYYTNIYQDGSYIRPNRFMTRHFILKMPAQKELNISYAENFTKIKEGSRNTFMSKSNVYCQGQNDPFPS